MTLKGAHWITGPFSGGYWWGVEAIPKDHRLIELHGGFATRKEAWEHSEYLLREFNDYESVKVVTIEAVQA